MLVPKLRFKREDGTDYLEWSSQSFSNTFTPLKNNTFSRDMLSENGVVLNIHYGDILVKYREICDIQIDDIPKVNADIDTSKCDRLQDGDIIIADTAEDETVGKATEIYHVGVSEIVSGLHTMACRPNDRYAPKYMGYYINSPTFHNQLLPYMQGIKVTSIGRKNIADTLIYFPSEMGEQQKIADFLSTVDEVIEQSEKEVQNLEQQKKAVMQKIFSQEVRFKREDGTNYPEWKEKKLNDISQYIVKKGTGTKNTFVGTENMRKNCAGVLFVDSDMTSVKGTIYEHSDILFSNIRPYLKKAWKADRCGICSSDVLCIRANNLVDSNFLYVIISSDSFFEYIMQGAKGTKMPRGDKNHIMNMPVFVPCLEEQQKIADFLSAFDEAITYAKQELEKWKELKKGLLQQMFV